MKLAIGCLLLLLTSVAHADETAMRIMQLMMRCPAMSADGKHLALYSQNPGSDADAKTSLAVFDTSGKLEQRISVVPPATDAARAKTAADKIVKLLDDGSYKRMGRVMQTSNMSAKGGLTAKVKSEDVELEVRVADRKVSIAGTRNGKTLTPITRKLPAKDGPCQSVDGYSFANTQAGYDAKQKLFAFLIMSDHGNEICFAHEFVVTLK